MNQKEWLVERIGLYGISSIDCVFNRLEEIYQKKWTDRFGNNEKEWKLLWAARFEEHDLTFREVDNGLLKCRKYPSRDIDLITFLGYCNPEIEPTCPYRESLKEKPVKIVKKGLERRKKGKTQEVMA